jgi:thiosulfate/3-mercaptopyruvate sulfurtransferase
MKMKVRIACSTPLFVISAALLAIFSLAGPASAANLGLIEPAALNGEQAKWVVLDARPKAEWQAGHIPGARSFCWENYTRTDEKGVEYRVLPPQQLAAALADMGIDEKTPVVVYGDADTSWGGEGWDAWVLSWLGHKGPIRLLNGGIQAWRARNLPLARGTDTQIAKKARYQVSLTPRIDITTEELERRKASLVIVDVRSTLEWLKGRIPGAIRIPWDDFHTGKDRHPLPPAQLKRMLEKHGVQATKPVVYYCTGGIRSGYAWLVHELSGLPDARNYEGGMAAWQKRDKK